MAWEVEVSDEFREWYEANVPRADAIYDQHLLEIG